MINKSLPKSIGASSNYMMTERGGNGIGMGKATWYVKPRIHNKKEYRYSQRIGEEPVMDFFENYKNLKKSVERDEHLTEP